MEEFASVKKKKIWIAAGIASLIVIMVVLSVINSTETETVKLTKLSQELIEEKLTLSGTISSTKKQIVYLQPERGELKKVWVEVGQKIVKGTKLLEYESPAIQGEKQQADLAVKQARLKVNSLKKQKSRGNQQMPLTSDQSIGSIDEQIKLAQLELEQAKQQVQQAKRKQNQLIVTSKQNGVVVKVNENAISGANSEPVVIVQDIDSVKIDSKVSEYDVLKIKKDQKTYISSEAIPERRWTGKVVKIGLIPIENQAPSLSQDQNTEVSYPIEVIADEKLPMKLGSRLILEVITSSKNAQALPQSAIKQEGNQSFVFVVKNGKAIKTPVKIGTRSEQWVEIISGVTKGQDVVRNPSPSLVNGAEVIVE